MVDGSDYAFDGNDNTKKFIIDQCGENLANAEYPVHTNFDSMSKSKTYQTEAQATHPATAGIKYLPFTPDMIRDQELLIFSMSQQGISESLMQHQFDRLIEEQIKQLGPLSHPRDGNKKISEKAKDVDKNKKAQDENVKEINKKYFGHSSYPVQKAYDRNYGCNTQSKPSTFYSHQTCHELPKPDPPENSTNDANISITEIDKSVVPNLMVTRNKNETVETRQRNNGLQDPSEALKIIKKYNGKRKNGKCMAPDVEKTFLQQIQQLSLNGVQDENAMKETLLLQSYPVSANSDKYQKPISANGLENSRNSHARNLMVTSKKIDNINNMQCPDSEQIDRIQTQEKLNTAMPTIANNSNSNSQIQEPRIIGGLTYFARKPLLHSA